MGLWSCGVKHYLTWSLMSLFRTCSRSPSLPPPFQDTCCGGALLCSPEPHHCPFSNTKYATAMCNHTRTPKHRCEPMSGLGFTRSFKPLTVDAPELMHALQRLIRKSCRV
jgi:hypothetical protein